MIDQKIINRIQAFLSKGETYVVLKSRSGRSDWYVNEVLKNKPSNNSVFIKGVVKEGGDRVITTRNKGSDLNILLLMDSPGHNFIFLDNTKKTPSKVFFYYVFGVIPRKVIREK